MNEPSEASNEQELDAQEEEVDPQLLVHITMPLLTDGGSSDEEEADWSTRIDQGTFHGNGTVGRNTLFAVAADGGDDAGG